jgi:hypothetical protein
MYVFWKGTKPMTNTKPFTDIELIAAIAERAAALYAKHTKVEPDEVHEFATTIALEVDCVHRKVRPLRLQQLLEADDSNFAHDIGGIRRHLDFFACKLNDCFVPRFAA